ncbi:MAG: FHA domain-containing protein, partial [Planctomycetota bacterium]
MGKYMVRNGDLEGRRFRLEPGAKITLGRELSDLNFPDKRMSRRHCQLEARDDGDHLQDLESTNGTWVNSQKVKEALLKPGDLLRIGFTELEFLGVPQALPHEPAVVRSDQTIAFRPLGALKAPPTERHRRVRGKSRI